MRHAFLAVMFLFAFFNGSFGLGLNDPSPTPLKTRKEPEHRATLSNAESKQDQQDPQETPLIANNKPPPATKSGAQKQPEDHAQKAFQDWWTLIFTGATAVFTGMLVVVGAGQLIMFWIQLQYLRDSVQDAKISAKAAAASADAAKESAATSRTAMISTERAFFYNAGFTWISHREPKSSRIFWRIRPTWKNEGNTPTRWLDIDTSYELRDTPLPNDFHFPDHRQNIVSPIMTVLGPKGFIDGLPYDLSVTISKWYLTGKSISTFGGPLFTSTSSKGLPST